MNNIPNKTNMTKKKKIKTREQKLPKTWSWLRQFRHDKGIWEDICTHGVGHDAGVHGCDGCCAEIGLYGQKKK